MDPTSEPVLDDAVLMKLSIEERVAYERKHVKLGGGGIQFNPSEVRDDGGDATLDDFFGALGLAGGEGPIADDDEEEAAPGGQGAAPAAAAATATAGSGAGGKEGAGGKAKADGLKRGFLNEEEPVLVPQDEAELAARVSSDLAECERFRAVVDDDTTPFDARYDERRVLLRLVKVLDKYAEADAAHALAARTPLGVVCSLLGNNFVDTEETSAGAAPLSRAIEMLGTGPRELLHRVDALNHMGMLCSEREQQPQALAHLTEAKDLYEQAMATNDLGYLTPLDTACATPAAERLERLHTHTLFYLAQVHGHLGDPLQSAVHAHATLRRQLARNDAEYEPFEWCKNAMQLATFYPTVRAFAVAEHCLFAATHVLASIPDEKRREPSGALSEKFQELRANIHLAWAGLMRAVLRAGRQEGSAAGPPVAPAVGDAAPILLSISEERLTFFRYLPALPAASAECLDPSSLVDFEAARAVYKRGQRHALYAKAYFVLDGFVSDHIVAADFEAKLWGAVLLYETDAKRVLAMHKKRIALLQPLLDAINPKAYHAIGRQLAFDLGQIYGDALDVRLLMLQGMPPGARDAKVLPMVEANVKGLRRFLWFFKDAEGKDLDRADPDHEEVYLQAHFNIARAYGKLDSREALGESLRAYEFIQSYATRHDVPCMREEIRMAREMCELLPTKVGRARPGDQ
mmetsp:Transcript_31830/g.79421  ORF Transcript_31830/g.79421 Transcript_31830/m.79421 type:complete len:689 (-) Transcript_31830:408-2474(-)